MKQLLTAFILINILFAAKNTNAQGCVAVRSNGASCTRNYADTTGGKGWQLNIGYRYFHSYKHFVGTAEQKERVEAQTDVRNWQHAMDLTLIRNINNRWSISMNLPIISNKRSSKYEHYGNTSNSPNARNSTRSFGIGDTRFAVARWMLNPLLSPKGNIQLGLGIKLPTGDYNYQDFFKKNDSTKILGPVDQSIQLGDGGTGISVEANAYYIFSHVVSVYGNFYYLINPREHNGVSTSRGAAPSATSIAYGSSVMSVPDQYMVRAGGNFMFGKFSLSAGGRLECIPVHDLIGGSSGFRRPGIIIGAEPGIAYQMKKVNLFATAPVWVVRNRTQSVPDKVRTKLTGVYAHGDAAFSDYTINIGCSIRF